MKKALFIIIYFFVVNCYSQNKGLELPQSDFLRTKLEIEKSVHANSERFKKFELKKIHDFTPENSAEDSICRRIGDSLKINEDYYKVDFDNNGLIDILMIGDDHNCEESRAISCNFSSLVMMSFPKDSVRIYNVNISSGCLIPKIIEKNNQILLEVYNRKKGILSVKGDNVEQHTLIYKYDGFIDYNEMPVKHSIEKIEFSTSGCYGTCPVFALEIDSQRNSTFFAERFNFGTDEENMKKMLSYNREGTFRGIIKEENYNQIVELLEYMNFMSLNDEYYEAQDDNQSSILKITYDNGKVKTINDYGLIGTYSLKKLYQMLFELRVNQKWK
jgi:hypothetical protein